MSKRVLAVVLSCLVVSQLFGSPRRPPRRPSPKGSSTISKLITVIGSFLKPNRPANDVRTLPPPPSTLISGG